MKSPTSRIHIGSKIQEQLHTDQRSVSWLARQIKCTRNHCYKIFRKPTLDSDLLLRISIAMNFNFFQYYSTEFQQNTKNRWGDEVR